VIFHIGISGQMVLLTKWSKYIVTAVGAKAAAAAAAVNTAAYNNKQTAVNSWKFSLFLSSYIASITTHV